MGCQFDSAASFSASDHVAILQMHARLHQLVLAPAVGGTRELVPAKVKTEKVIRPRLELKDSYVEEERFAFFKHRWEEYKVIAAIKENAKQEHFASVMRQPSWCMEGMAMRRTLL